MADNPMARLGTVLMAIILTTAACSPAGSPALGSPAAAETSSSRPVGSVSPTESNSAAPSAAGAQPLTSDPLHLIELLDVNSTMTFTLGQLAAEGPVLFEMMAIWCTNCRAQQHEVIAAHDRQAFTSVSLDIDPNERPGDLAEYSSTMGFGWRFALANQALASALRDRFGAAVLNPPSTPMVLLFPDGSVRALEFRAYSAEELAAEIAAG